ncbi:MAG TPA: 2-hydroxyacyl-CoA dehydratase family protein [Hyphomonadaceae bacterium]|jgi:benzoyl-CoA reductase/2-hydroxyglutaryl-CoA dehydratase subunit BcrC/BadD/HgdB|nr:2-hydroxyacyl-CoA dehydratase family protein [Hyphomonadaceae bacterium]
MAPASASFGTVDAVRRDAEALAQRAAASGQKVCGWLGVGSPVELIDAAGLHPMELSAGDAHATPLADEYMEDLFDPVVRGVFERLLRGEFSYLSAIVLPRSGDSVHRFYYYLCELKRAGIANLPEPILFDCLQAQGAPSNNYTRDRLEEFRAKLATVSGHIAGEAELAAVMARASQRSEALQEIARHHRSGTLAAEEALATYAAARMLPHDEFLARASAVLADNAESRSRNAPRIVIAGSPHDDAGLHRTIAEAGGEVVGDFHAAGELSIGASLGRNIDALLDFYRTRWTPRSFGDPAERLLTFAREANADAVVFSFFPVEEALTWDYPAQAAALAANGIATLRLPDQARPYDPAAAAQLGAFIAKLAPRRK